MVCQKCLDRWGQEPFYMGDTSMELIAYFKHRVFHLGESVDIVPEYWVQDVLDYDSD